jgi:hypothetical protein
LGVGLTTPPWKKNVVTKSEEAKAYDEMAAMDREDWRKLLKKGRAHTGLSSQ